MSYNAAFSPFKLYIAFPIACAVIYKEFYGVWSDRKTRKVRWYSDSLDCINLGVGSLVSDALALTDQHLVHWWTFKSHQWEHKKLAILHTVRKHWDWAVRGRGGMLHWTEPRNHLDSLSFLAFLDRVHWTRKQRLWSFHLIGTNLENPGLIT